MDHFVSEPLTPVAGTADTAATSRGEPGLPARFTWQEHEYTVRGVRRTWKTSSRGLCGDNYLRRHWYEIDTTDGLRMTLYCDRQARDRKKPRQRWWVYSVGG